MSHEEWKQEAIRRIANSRSQEQSMDRQVQEILDFWRSNPDQMPRNADVLIIEAKLDVEYLTGLLLMLPAAIVEYLTGLLLMLPAAINVSGDASSLRADHHGDAEAVDAL